MRDEMTTAVDVTNLTFGKMLRVAHGADVRPSVVLDVLGRVIHECARGGAERVSELEDR